MKTGLVLEGGGVRGIYTAGVLDVFMENGIEFDGVIGVSAGACFGCNYKSGQTGRTLRYNLKYCKDPRMAGFRSLLLTGDIYGAAEKLIFHGVYSAVYFITFFLEVQPITITASDNLSKE